ncbi:MAG: histidinol dehydrogenase [Phycisphaerales bacterium]
MLRRVRIDAVQRGGRSGPVADVLADASAIVADVQDRGIAAVVEYGRTFGEVERAEDVLIDSGRLRRSLEDLDSQSVGVLERVADRIAKFARAQRDMYRDVGAPVPGGMAGHTVEPVESAGCYAPGGRYPLPSSVLMTAVTARAAGVERVIVASPRPTPAMLAAAAIAGADAYMAVGGAHAVAALAYGLDGFEPVDVIAGPGNAWVTAAKQLVSGRVGIDMLAGPSELLIIADASADAATIAADLLAQAEHDADASAMLVTTSASLADAVDQELSVQIEQLPSAATARQGLANGFCCVVDSIEQAIDVADTVAPEHLEVCTADAQAVAARVRHAGGVFVGEASAEVFGDYGFGPNHTLPTGGTARYMGGLSVAHFLRLRTWLRIDEPEAAGEAMEDAVALARMEGLEGHARSALRRLRRVAPPPA